MAKNNFSLLIPTYNGERYIEQSILSGLNQTRSFDEIIISDDNSSDSTVSICEKYSNQVKIYKNPNGPSGFVNGWNNAISKANGEYISILHQDDLLDKDFLLRMEGELEKHKHILHAFSTCYYVNEKGEISASSFTGNEQIKLYKSLEYVKAYQSSGNPHIHRCPGVITHRSIFDRIQYNPAAGHIADDDFFYRVGKYTDILGVLTPLASYRIHNTSETGKLHDIQLTKRLQADYAYQVKQWKQDSFLDKEAYSYFTYWLKKYKIRNLYNGIKKLDIKTIFYALR